MFQPRHQHFIAGLEVRPPPTIGDQINALGDAAYPDDLAGLGAIDKLGSGFTGRFKLRGSAIAQGVRAAVRGVQSNTQNPIRSKVTSFLDGIPMVALVFGQRSQEIAARPNGNETAE